VSRVSEQDLELLEAYLDGELSAQEAAEVRMRLAGDLHLSAELETLRAERAVRQSVFETYEPTELEAAAVVARVERQVMRRRGWDRLNRGLRWASAAAACIIVGFFVGSLGRDGGGTPVVNDQLPQRPIRINNDHQSPSQPYFVRITDETGRVVAVQQFATYEQARAFVEDFGKWQQRQKQVRDGKVLMVGDRF
jgi:hypothetical protein